MRRADPFCIQGLTIKTKTQKNVTKVQRVDNGYCGYGISILQSVYRISLNFECGLCTIKLVICYLGSCCIHSESLTSFMSPSSVSSRLSRALSRFLSRFEALDLKTIWSFLNWCQNKLIHTVGVIVRSSELRSMAATNDIFFLSQRCLLVSTTFSPSRITQKPCDLNFVNSFLYSSLEMMYRGRTPRNHMSKSCGNGIRSRWNISGPCVCKFVIKSTPAASVWARLVSIVCVWTSTAFSRSSWLRSRSLP